MTGFGRWSNRLPLCKKKPRSMIGKCEELQSDGIVAIECSQEYYMGSICAFSCPTGYRLIGPSMSTCENDLSWSHDMPLSKVRIVISKWAASKVLKANSRLFQFIYDDVGGEVLVSLALIDDLLRYVSNSIPRKCVQELQPQFYNCESKLHKKSKRVLRCFPSQIFKTKNSKTLESHNLIVTIICWTHF